MTNYFLFSYSVETNKDKSLSAELKESNMKFADSIRAAISKINCRGWVKLHAVETVFCCAVDEHIQSNCDAEMVVREEFKTHLPSGIDGRVKIHCVVHLGGITMRDRAPLEFTICCL